MRASLRSGFALGALCCAFAAPSGAQEAAAEAEVDPAQLLAAVAFFESVATDDQCLRNLEMLDEEDLAPRVHALPPHPETGAREILFQFLCDRGAYNESFLFVSADPQGRFALLQFPALDIDVDYVGDDPEGAVQAIRIMGLRLKSAVVNAAFDPETGAISEDSRWRGIGDASSASVWSYAPDPEAPFVSAYRLTEYRVDASYDGEINPVAVIPIPISVSPAP